MPEPVLQNKLRAAAFRYAGAHPLYIAQVGYRNTLRLAGFDGHAEFLSDARGLKLPQWPIRLAWSTTEFAVLMALAGVLSGAARGSPRFVWVGGILLMLTTVLVNTESLRFQVTFGPFLALL